MAAADLAEPTLVVPPEVVSELRRALVADLQSVSIAIGELVRESNADRRAASYSQLVSNIGTRYQLQTAAGWPDDPKPDAELIIQGDQCAVAIRCLTRYRDARLDRRVFESLSGKSPPPSPGAVGWPGSEDLLELSTRLKTLNDFLAANPQPRTAGLSEVSRVP